MPVHPFRTAAVALIVLLASLPAYAGSDNEISNAATKSSLASPGSTATFTGTPQPNSLVTLRKACAELLHQSNQDPQKADYAATRFAMVVPELAGIGMAVGTIGADGSFSRMERVIPAHTQQALALSESINLTAYSITTMVLHPQRPEQSPRPAINSDNYSDFKRHYGVERLAWERAGAASGPGNASSSVVDKILVTVPDEQSDAFAFWPMTRRTFAVVACPVTENVRAKVYVAERTLSDLFWTAIDTALAHHRT